MGEQLTGDGHFCAGCRHCGTIHPRCTMVRQGRNHTSPEPVNNSEKHNLSDPLGLLFMGFIIQTKRPLICYPD